MVSVSNDLNINSEQMIANTWFGLVSPKLLSGKTSFNTWLSGVM